MEESVKNIEKYLKSITKSLETIAKNTTEKIKEVESERDEAIKDANEIIAILEQENIPVSDNVEEEIITSLQD